MNNEWEGKWKGPVLAYFKLFPDIYLLDGWVGAE
jgi:hypothetical protein